MKSLVKLPLMIACLSTASIVSAQPVEGSREVTLSGAGGSDNEFDNNIFSLEGSYGVYLSPQSIVGVRQSVGFSDTEGQESSWNGATRGFFDYHFGDEIRPYVGAMFGYVYGDGVEETFIAGPEVGIKSYVLENTFITANVEYQFFFEDADNADSRFDDGAFAYSVGMGFNF